jgi:hypothetical protein
VPGSVLRFVVRFAGSDAEPRTSNPEPNPEPENRTLHPAP